MNWFQLVRRVVLTVLLVMGFGVLPVLHLLWRLEPNHELDVLVFDVTVVDGAYREHAVLDRVLHHERVEYRLGADHVGAGPGGEPFGTWPIDQPDLIVLADAYGVYQNDDRQIDDFGRNLVSPVLDTSQAADIERWIANGVPAYGEFALTPDPTPVAASEYIQDAFGFDASGWLGHAEEELAAVGPNIKALGPTPWPYQGPGMIFVSTVAGDAEPRRQLVVLTADELDANQPVFVGGPSGSRGDHAPFARWFELVEPTEAVVESWIDMPVNEQGAATLQAAGLPTRWPGVITTPTTVYVVGDGLEDESGFSFRSFAHGDWISWRFDDSPDERFFHQVLRPALSRTVDLAVARTSAELADTTGSG